VSSPAEDPLVEQMFDAATKQDQVLEAVKKLSPEQAAFFLEKLERAYRKRKIQVTGYLAAILCWLLGMVFALVWFGTHDGFVGWVFLVPFGLVGLILWAFGKYAERISATPPPKPISKP
jgi:hypothetical protein